MPHAKRVCAACQRDYRPKSSEDAARGTCRSCEHLKRAEAERAFPYALRFCEVCHGEFNSRDGEKRCPSCRRLAQTLRPAPAIEEHWLAPPLKQAVFDLETYGGLCRGWGVLIAGCVLGHGEKEAKWFQYDLTQSPKWPDKRSDDSHLAANLLEVLSKYDVLYAHNGRNFDIPYINTVALKFDLPRIRAKLVDPVQICRRNYRIGNNSLSAVCDFLGLPEPKLRVPADVWRYAVLDNDAPSWATIRERCQSDVRILNAMAGKVTRDAGMIDNDGSAWRR